MPRPAILFPATPLLPCFALLLLVGACVPRAPVLTEEQRQHMHRMEVFADGIEPEREYVVVEELTAVDCTGAPARGRIWGNEYIAFRQLKMKAAAIDADALIGVSCGTTALLNNCWAPKKCDGTAVRWKNDSGEPPPQWTRPAQPQ